MKNKKTTKRKQAEEVKKQVICFNNSFSKLICKSKTAAEIVGNKFYVPILEMETPESYSAAISALKMKYFDKPFMAINNICIKEESEAILDPSISRIYVGGLIMDDNARVLLVKEGDTYTIPNYILELSQDAYTKSVNKMIVDVVFDSLGNDFNIYPKEEGDNQAFDAISGVIVNSNKGEYEYVNKTLFLVNYLVNDFDRLIVEHNGKGKQAVVLTLEEAASLVDHKEVSNPWLDYIILSLV